MKLFQVLLLAVLTFSFALVFAEDDSMYPQDDSVLTTDEKDIGGLTDSEVPPTQGALSDADISNLVAFGTVYSNGSKQSGTTNWTSSYNSTYTRYEISIIGENYYYLRYATNITPAGDMRYCKSSSVGGKLLVYCYDKNGNPASSRFGFTTFRYR
jgi:hypothetical protein